jgi:hypothetical protein
MTSERTIFKSKFWPSCGWFCTLTISLFAIFSFIDDGFDINWTASIFACFALLILGAITTFVVNSLFFITVTPDGVKGYNAWGKRRFIEWNEMTEIRTFNMIGLPYVRVYTDDDSSPLCIPMFLSKMDQFVELVNGLAPDENKLKEHLSGVYPAET